VILLHNARLFHGPSRSVHGAAWLLIDAERIADVGTGELPLPRVPDATMLDLDGLTLLPGLINLHVHFHLDGSGDTWGRLASETDQLLSLRSVGTAKAMLSRGITSVRDLGAKGPGIIALRQAIQERLLPGPRIQAAGQAICMTGGHFRVGGSVEVDGVPEMLAAARRQFAAGADLLKLMATSGMTAPPGVPLGTPELSFEELHAGVAVAHALGRRAAAHALGAEGIKNAVRAGVDTLEHGPFLDDEAIELLLAHGTTLVPTLTAYHRMAEHVGRGALPPRVAKLAAEVHQGHLELVGRAFRAGVKIGIGSDAGSHFNPHDDLVTELQLLVEAGIPSGDVLQMAGEVSASAMGWGHLIGALEPGRLADVIAVHGNPLEDVGVLRNVGLVVKSGEIVVDNTRQASSQKRKEG
jgi:imidazolonepropionase-like amidohydrolase